MKGDFHVRFCENTEVEFFCVTRLAAMLQSNEIINDNKTLLKWK